MSRCSTQRAPGTAHGLIFPEHPDNRRGAAVARPARQEGAGVVFGYRWGAPRRARPPRRGSRRGRPGPAATPGRPARRPRSTPRTPSLVEDDRGHGAGQAVAGGLQQGLLAGPRPEERRGLRRAPPTCAAMPSRSGRARTGSTSSPTGPPSSTATPDDRARVGEREPGPARERGLAVRLAAAAGAVEHQARRRARRGRTPSTIRVSACAAR